MFIVKIFIYHENEVVLLKLELSLNGTTISTTQLSKYSTFAELSLPVPKIYYKTNCLLTASGKTYAEEIFASKKVSCMPKNPKINIGLNRLVYTGDQDIKASIYVKEQNGKKAIVSILDPEGFTVRKWPTNEFFFGFLSVTYQLPSYPKVSL